MSHLWQQINDRWEPAPLTGPALALDAGGELRPAAPGDVSHLRFLAVEKDSWVLLASPAGVVRVNGDPVVAGIRVLRDRDEIVLGGARCFFSAERLARIEPFPGADGDVICPRCKRPIAPATPAIRCPGCGTWHHQEGERSCFTYAPKCALCEQASDLNAGFRWQPEF